MTVQQDKPARTTSALTLPPNTIKLPLSERWLYHRSPLKRLLTLLAWTYQGASLVHAKLSRKRKVSVSTPIIGVGSLLVGGAGKSEAVAYCAQLLRQLGHRVGIVSGGTKRKSVETLIFSAPPEVEESGDEAWMLAERLFPTKGLPPILHAVSSSKAKAVSALHERHSDLDVVLVDDSFQHWRLERDLDLVLIPPNLGSLSLFPLGPLREPVHSLARADLVWQHCGAGDHQVQGGAEEATIDVMSCYRLRGFARVWPSTEPAFVRDLSEPVTLLSAVARNQNVCDLVAGRAQVMKVVALPDHAPLERALSRLSGVLVVTAKDWPKARAFLRRSTTHQINAVWRLEISLRFLKGERQLTKRLEEAIEASR